ASSAPRRGNERRGDRAEGGATIFGWPCLVERMSPHAPPRLTMRPAAVATLLTLCANATAPAQDAAGPEMARFLRANPGYRQRAGAFYEAEYLPGAAAGLARAARAKGLSEQDARAALRPFVYDWLDAYISGGGAVSPAGHAGVLRRLDDRVRAALDDDAAFARYLAWRQNAQGADNPLDFLMRPPAP